MKKRTKVIEFHIKMGDYFGTLATVLDLLRQRLVDKEEEERILKNLTADLLYLQKRFKITPKIGVDK
jgi:hypothetical protein